jgi:hypothetical protein
VTLPLSAMTGVMNAAIKALAAHVRRIDFGIMLPSYISLRLKIGRARKLYTPYGNFDGNQARKSVNLGLFKNFFLICMQQ